MNESVDIICEGGPVSFGYVKGNDFEVIEVKPKNLVLYGAQDILGKLVSGNPDYMISAAYFEYTQDTSPSVTPAKDEGQSYYAGLSSPQDFIRSTVISQGATSGADSNFNSNRVTFFAATSGVEGYNGTPFNTDSTVYGAALVATPTNNFSGDIVFSRIYFQTPLPKLTGSDIGFQWTLQFNSGS